MSLISQKLMKCRYGSFNILYFQVLDTSKKISVRQFKYFFTTFEWNTFCSTNILIGCLTVFESPSILFVCKCSVNQYVKRIRLIIVYMPGN